MYVDYIMNGRGMGPVGEHMQGCRFDPGLLRPYIDRTGTKCVTIQTGETIWNSQSGLHEPKYARVPVSDILNQGIQVPVNNTLTLRKDEWIQLDRQVLEAARRRLRAWTDLEEANTFGGFQGMSKMVLEHETQSDPGEALVDMDGLSAGRQDAPQYQLEGLPLPITHCNFFFSSRRLAASRNSGTPLDTTMSEAAGRRVAEKIEQTTIGTIAGMQYGDGSGIYGRNNGAVPKVYGYLNFPDRITKTDMTAPDGNNGETILSEWLACRELLYSNNFYGDFIVYTDTGYDQYLDDEFKTNSDKSLRTRLLEIDGISAIRRLDYMTPSQTGYASTIIWVQMTPDVARAVNGMSITTVQWETQGGMRLNFKVMAIMVPQLRADFYNQCGILEARTAA